MQQAADGMWQAVAEGDLKGSFYAFNVKIDGIWQGDTPGVMAKAVGVNGDRAAIIDMRETNPQGWEKGCTSALKKVFLISLFTMMHHRDFPIDTVAGIKHRGKFAGSDGRQHPYLSG